MNRKAEEKVVDRMAAEVKIKRLTRQLQRNIVCNIEGVDPEDKTIKASLHWDGTRAVTFGNRIYIFDSVLPRDIITV